MPLTKGLIRMARLLGAPNLMDCFLMAGSGFAAGGTCPSGANYLNATTGTKVTLARLELISSYYISAAGSESNTGTTRTAGECLASAIIVGTAITQASTNFTLRQSYNTGSFGEPPWDLVAGLAREFQASWPLDTTPDACVPDAYMSLLNTCK